MHDKTSAVAESEMAARCCMCIRGVHDTGIPMGPMGILWVPWESHGNEKHRLNSWEWEREWEWWTGNERELRIVVWKKFPLVALIILLAEQFAISS